MCNKYGNRLIGQFWVVWDKIECACISLDDTSNPLMEKVDGCIRYNVDREEAWQDIKEFNQYPNKGVDHYPHGEIVFDTAKCKFKVTGTPKLMCDASFQHKLIKNCGLTQWTIFVKE